MKLPENPRLPTLGGADYARSLYARLYELFRGIANQVNALSEGRVVATYNADTAPPASGEHAVGDFLRNSTPAVTGGYIVIGWICVAAGSPGTWKECRCPTA
jgi:hypothetical protein